MGKKNELPNFSRLLNASARITFWTLHVKANFVLRFFNVFLRFWFWDCAVRTGNHLWSVEKIVSPNFTHKHSQLGSQITEPTNARKVYFRWPPGEIYARNLQSTLAFCIALKAKKNFLAARFFLEAGGAKWGRQQRGRPLESNLKRLGAKSKLVKENAPASNEPINFRKIFAWWLINWATDAVFLRESFTTVTAYRCFLTKSQLLETLHEELIY